MNESKYLVGLSLISGLGPRRYQKLIDFYGSPERIWHAPDDSINNYKELGESFIQQFVVSRKSIDLGTEMDKLERLKVKTIDINSSDYPINLKNIYDPPFLLYYQGSNEYWKKPWIAIVGSRKMTTYGKEIAFWLGKELSSRGIVVVSGLARGIDTWAHKGALEGGGLTAAVLGCGLDICYPPENKKLYQVIAEENILLSEFPLGTSPKRQYFPLRNRIISGLSLGTVVVEAASKSGALITAYQALEQGREVFAVPGPIKSPSSRGCHNLIKLGAKLVQDIDDILEELLINGDENNITPGSLSVDKNMVLSDNENQLLNSMSFHPTSIDYLAEEMSWPVAKINATLTLLEVKGIISKEPGNYFLRIK